MLRNPFQLFISNVRFTSSPASSNLKWVWSDPGTRKGRQIPLDWISQASTFLPPWMAVRILIAAVHSRSEYKIQLSWSRTYRDSPPTFWILRIRGHLRSGTVHLNSSHGFSNSRNWKSARDFQEKIYNPWVVKWILMRIVKLEGIYRVGFKEIMGVMAVIFSVITLIAGFVVWLSELVRAFLGKRGVMPFGEWNLRYEIWW